MSSATGRSLELFYINGRPDGMIAAEVFNWTGHVLMVPRTQLGAALDRTEARHTGIYILLGEREGAPLAYIGEGEDIGHRIRSHDVNKDWWNSVVLITTAGNKLNKAHVKYLEARLIEQASAIARTPLENATRPSLASISESDTSKMEAFLENLSIVLPALRVDLFIERSRPTLAPEAAEVLTSSDVERFILQADRRGADARAELRDGEFIVEAGSVAAVGWSHQPTLGTTYSLLRDELSRSGVLVLRDGEYVFTQNYAFRSPSAAASVVLGRIANGTTEWKHAGTLQTYKAWEKDQLARAGGEER